MPVTFDSRSRLDEPIVPKSPDELRICGSIARGTPNAPSSSSSQSRVVRSISSVRDALVTSVACSPVRFHSSQLSGVPKSSSPRSARSLAPSTFARIQAILLAEK